MKNVARLAATAVIAAGLGLAGLGATAEAQAQPGPVAQWWCPGAFWDPGWGDNWDWGHCHDNWRGPGPDPHWGAGWGHWGPPPPHGPGHGGPGPHGHGPHGH